MVSETVPPQSRSRQHAYPLAKALGMGALMLIVSACTPTQQAKHPANDGAASSAETHTWQEIAASEELFLQRYEARENKQVTAAQPVQIEHYVLRQDRPEEPELPPGVFRITGGGKTLLLESQQWPDTGLEAAVDANGSVIALANAGGGNAWNANAWYVIAVDAATGLQPVGTVSKVETGPEGALRLLWVDDRLENLPWLSHADAPNVWVPFEVRDARLQMAEKSAFCAENLRRVEAHVEDLKASVPPGIPVDELPPNTNALLQAILQRFLHVWFCEGEAAAWTTLVQDLAHRDSDYFVYCPQERVGGARSGCGSLTQYPIGEIMIVLRGAMAPPEPWIAAEE